MHNYFDKVLKNKYKLTNQEMYFLLLTITTKLHVCSYIIEGSNAIVSLGLLPCDINTIDALLSHFIQKVYAIA